MRGAVGALIFLFFFFKAAAAEGGGIAIRTTKTLPFTTAVIVFFLFREGRLQLATEMRPNSRSESGPS